MHLAKKAVYVWLFTSLTFIALLHLIDAISAAIFGNQIKLLQLYPFINEQLKTITPTAYLWISATATFILWGITCAIAFENPVETFLNKILSDAKQQSTVETQLLEEKSEILDIMNETINSSNETLSHVKDIVYNIRADVKEIEPLKDVAGKIEAEMGNLRSEVKRLEEKMYFPTVCVACGKPIMPEFKICPYCGESIKPQTLEALTSYK